MSGSAAAPAPINKEAKNRASLEAKVAIAPQFYRVIVISALLGVALIYAGMHPIQMLFWASAFNGLLAPPSIASFC
ncbi:MAG TPA: hypothetical protein VMF91_23305 [Bryobacteraceae bacterium]|nr:hypothetical protein [Bryobacteraceae bacterium]